MQEAPESEILCLAPASVGLFRPWQGSGPVSPSDPGATRFAALRACPLATIFRAFGAALAFFSDRLLRGGQSCLQSGSENLKMND
jgi:hypothetical protein